MAAKSSPITASVLDWALSEDGRSRQDIAESVGVDEATLDAWANGEELPTTGAVTSLAEKLRRPRAMFFMPAPPVTATLPANFRHPPGENRPVSPTARRRVRQARRLQSVLSETLEGTPPPPVPRVYLESSPTAAAAAAREWLGVGMADQLSWSDDYEALRAWRSALDARGIFVFALEIGSPRSTSSTSEAGDTEIRGFSAWDEYAPLIVMNSRRVSAAARIYTLGHELGHLLLRVDAACNDDADAKSLGAPLERWCEAFSAALLMPEDAVRHQMRIRGLSGDNGTIEHVRFMMRAFRVSARASALKLISLGLAKPQLYSAVLVAFKPAPSTQRADKMANPPRSALRLRQFGPRALDAVFRDVDPIEALSMLNMTALDARELVGKVPGAAVL